MALLFTSFEFKIKAEEEHFNNGAIVDENVMKLQSFRVSGDSARTHKFGEQSMENSEENLPNILGENIAEMNMENLNMNSTIDDDIKVSNVINSKIDVFDENTVEKELTEADTLFFFFIRNYFIRK